MIEYLQHGFELELLYTAELPEYFNYLAFAYEMMSINRQQLMQPILGGKEYIRFVNFDKLADSSDFFLKARKEMTNAQKLVCDQFEYARGMHEICTGMHLLTHALVREGVISDPWKQYDENEYTKNCREMNYNQRYGFFRNVQFPRFKSYEDYQAKVKSVEKLTRDELFDLAKTHLIQGKQCLNNLEQTPADQRNEWFLSVDELKKI